MAKIYSKKDIKGYAEIDKYEHIASFEIWSENMGLIHIVISTDLIAESIKKIATENNSDHDGINCSIKFAWFLNGEGTQLR